MRNKLTKGNLKLTPLKAGRSARTRDSEGNRFLVIYDDHAGFADRYTVLTWGLDDQARLLGREVTWQDALDLISKRMQESRPVKIVNNVT